MWCKEKIKPKLTPLTPLVLAKLIHFAALTLQSLLILPVSATAVGGDMQEIGETYGDFLSKLDVMADSARLATTGEGLYTLKAGVLSLYHLSPLQRISAVNVDFDTTQHEGEYYRMFIMPDEKRIILYSSKQLRLLDVASGKLIKTVPFESDAGILNENELLTVDNHNKATVWNARDLTIKMKFEAIGDERWIPFEGYIVNHSYFLRAGNRILLYRPYRRAGFNEMTVEMNNYSAEIFVYDASTYKYLWKVEDRLGLRPIFTSDLRLLYLRCGDYTRLWRGGHHATLEDELRQKYKNPELRCSYGQFDISTGQLDLPTPDFVHKNSENSRRSHIYPYFEFRHKEHQISPTARYQLIRVEAGLVIVYFESDKPRVPKFFIQFANGEAALIDRAGDFVATWNARSSMKMKNKTGEIVPINEATYEKFNKQHIDHKEW